MAATTVGGAQDLPKLKLDLEPYGRAPYPGGTLEGMKALREPTEAEAGAKPPPGGKYFREQSALLYAELRKAYPTIQNITVGYYLTPLDFDRVIAFYSSTLGKKPQDLGEDAKVFELRGEGEVRLQYVEVREVPPDIAPEVQLKKFGIVGVKTEVTLVHVGRPK
jgi:hypothetical protein